MRVNRRKPNLAVHLPNIFTAGNLLSGFLSILYSTNGNTMSASWFIVIGACFDFLDGRIARLTGTTSDFGVEFDSLSDFVTFGVAPLILLHQLGIYGLNGWEIAVALSFLLASAFRLSRFNLNVECEQKRDFRGLPTPAAALTLVSYHFFENSYLSNYILSERIEFFYMPMMLGISWLMITDVRYTSQIKLGKKGRFIKLLLYGLALIAVLIWPKLTLFPFLLLYILYWLIKALVKFVNGQIHNSDDHIDELE
jgi:CDP-diacylglycerol--serine O-phosphatidyltransferase